jgi:hypothetical protein
MVGDPACLPQAVTFSPASDTPCCKSHCAPFPHFILSVSKPMPRNEAQTRFDLVDPCLMNKRSTVATNVFLRRFHNFALDRSWAAQRPPEQTHLEGNHGKVRWNP